MKRNTLFLILLGLIFVVGCETIKGAGKDIENTGKNIQEISTPNPKPQS